VGTWTFCTLKGPGGSSTLLTSTPLTYTSRSEGVVAAPVKPSDGVWTKYGSRLQVFSTPIPQKKAPAPSGPPLTKSSPTTQRRRFSRSSTVRLVMPRTTPVVVAAVSEVWRRFPSTESPPSKKPSSSFG
jgi:hypothetical protein